MKKMKPKIKIKDGKWWCTLGDKSGVGVSITHAYLNWKTIQARSSYCGGKNKDSA